MKSEPMNLKPEKLVTCYDLLGVAPHADSEEIKQAYRQQLKKWHPDKNAGRLEEAEEKTKRLNHAYSILKDAGRRKQYDAMLRYTRERNFDRVLQGPQFWEKVEKAAPALKRILKNLKDLYCLFVDSVKGKYKLDPVALSIIGGGLLYFIIPLDLIPDYLPLAGYLDDFALLSTIINSFHEEIAAYRNWKQRL